MSSPCGGTLREYMDRDGRLKSEDLVERNSQELPTASVGEQRPVVMLFIC